VGPACATQIAQLLADRILEKLRAAQGVLRLADRYGNARLERVASDNYPDGSATTILTG